jgi:GMP synthase-like glutamine amidotransferase
MTAMLIMRAQEGNLMSAKVHVLQHVSFEGPGTIEDWCMEKNLPVTRTRFFERDWNLPKPEEFDLLVVMGGPMSVHDEHEFQWLKKEKRFIDDAISANKKVLGVCLGAQLIASVLGARVYPNEHKEIGWFKVQKTEQAKALNVARHFPESFDVFQWHGDTFDLPRRCVQLFRADACKQQGFSLGSQVIGLQFHIEVTTGSILGFLANNPQDLEATGPFVQSPEQIKSNLAKTQPIRPLLFGLLDEFLRATMLKSAVQIG